MEFYRTTDLSFEGLKEIREHVIRQPTEDEPNSDYIEWFAKKGDRLFNDVCRENDIDFKQAKQDAISKLLEFYRTTDLSFEGLKELREHIIRQPTEDEPNPDYIEWFAKRTLYIFKEIPGSHLVVNNKTYNRTPDFKDEEIKLVIETESKMSEALGARVSMAQLSKRLLGILKANDAYRKWSTISLPTLKNRVEKIIHPEKDTRKKETAKKSSSKYNEKKYRQLKSMSEGVSPHTDENYPTEQFLRASLKSDDNQEEEEEQDCNEKEK